jgi:hypothetical protein
MLSDFESDTVLFFTLEFALFAFCIVAVFLERRILASHDTSDCSASVTRGEVSMGKFYAAYGVASGVLIGLAFSVEVVEGHRTFFTLLNAAIPAYLCLVNGWFRNKLLGWLKWLKEREKK